MKKILLLMFCMVFLIGSISALDIDNKLSYLKGENGNPDLKVHFEDTFLWVFPMGDIGTAELKSHKSVNEIKKVGYGQEEVVMWYEFDFNEIYSNGLGQITFTNERTGEIINKDYSFVYFGNETRQRNIYEKVCSKELNGTSCNYVVSGQESYQYETWLPYNSKDIPKGKIIIGLKTYVEKDDYIDGVWEIGGKKVSRHSTWEANLNTNLEVYYNFEDTSSALVDVLGNTSRDGIKIGVPTNVTGKIGSATQQVSSGGLDWFNMTWKLDFPEGTIAFWWKVPDIATDEKLLGFDAAGVNPNEWNGVMSLNSPFVTRFGITSWVNGNDTRTSNNWSLVVLQWSSTNGLRGFSDGVIAARDVTQTSLINGTYWAIGGNANLGETPDNTIDEVGVWSRWLTPAEVTQLWNDTHAITYYIVVNLAPQTNIYSPTNSSYSDSTIYFNATNVTNEVDTYILNYNGTNITNFNINTYLNVEDGKHNLLLYANGTDGNWSVNSSIYFTVDTASPILNITNLINGTTNTTNYTTSSKVTLQLNWTSEDTTLNTCWFYNVSSQANETITCNNNVTMQIPYGTHNFRVYANDSMGRLGSDEVTSTWSSKLIQNAIFYNENAYEISEESFVINISSDGTQTVTGSLFYNDTLYSTTKSGTNLNTNYSKTITVPSGVANNSFYFSFNYGSEIINSSTYYQNVFAVTLTNCTSGTIYFNVTAKDEETQNLLSDTNNITLETNFVYYINDQNANRTFNNSFNSSWVSFCLTPSDIDINIFGEIGYEDETHVKERYYFIEDSFSNSTTNISLYDLLTTDSTSFVVYLVDSASIPVDEAYYKLKRKYLSTNEFKVVEMAKSDDFGLGVLHFVTEDETYRIDFYNNNGSLLYSTDEFPAVCLDTICSLTFTLPFSSEISPFEEISGNPDFTFALNKSSDVVYLIFNSENSTGYDILFEVYGVSIANDTVSLCSETQSSVSSGSANCNVSGQNYDSFLARVWVNGQLEVSRYVAEFDEGWQTYRTFGVILTLFIVIALTLLFAWHWILALIGSTVGLAISIWLQFIPGTLTTLSYIIIVVVYLIITGGNKQ